MAGRKVVQDSDDEGDDLGAITPHGSPLGEQDAASNRFNHEESFPSTRPPQASNEGSIASTEKLHRQIYDANRNLLTQTTPSTETSARVATPSGHSLQTSTTSKLKRRQTTVSAKKSKTYGTKTTLDDLVLCDSDWAGDLDKKETKKRLMNPDFSIKIKRISPKDPRIADAQVGGDEGNETLAAGRFGARTLKLAEAREPSAFNPEGITQPTVPFDENKLPPTGSNRKYSGVAKEDHLPPTATNRNYSDPTKESTGLPSTSSSRKYTGLSREEDEAINLALRELPSLVSTECATQLQFQEVQVEPDTQSQHQVVHGDQDELALEVLRTSLDGPKTTKTKKKRRIEEHTQDAADYDPLCEEQSGTTAKSKKKRKIADWAKDSADSDHDGELPVENYEPRPSKFRATPVVDERVESVKWSPRPETPLKSKSKIMRRKTTGNALLRREEVQDEEEPFITEMVSSKKDSVKQDILTHDDKPTINLPGATEKQNASTITLNIPKGNADANEEAPPKKKRGRPKKSDTQLAEDPPNLKKAKRKGTASTDTASLIDDTAPANNMDEELFVSEDEQPPAKEPHVLSDLKDRVNAVKQSSKATSSTTATGEETKESSPAPLKENTPGPVPPPLKDITPVVQTPVKQTGNVKGPKGHSPLNSGKVAYRVGLSKRARIPPLLRSIKK